jgi:glutathione synthase/RimK-type ligase-like ATP-grasp enzyme
MQNKSRHIVAILAELCEERNIRMVSFSDDWIHRLEKDGRVSHVFGYDFAINSATARLLAKDKAATATILQHAGVPVVEHRLFHAPTMSEYVPLTGNWSEMLRYLERNRGVIVCKPNEGTGGTDVFRVSSAVELEAAVNRIFQKQRSLCLSPLFDAVRELRFVIVDEQCYVAYEKVRPYVEGDGVATTAQLVAASGESSKALDPRGRAASDANPIKWDAIPAKGERVLLSWRHNLGRGASSELISDTDPVFSAGRKLAIAACHALGLRAASVDVFATADALLVLEVNAGIMMENLASQGQATRELAKRVYGKLLDSVLA